MHQAARSAASDEQTESTRGAATRQNILAAAKELVALHGPDGFTVRDIAARSQANHAAIAYYFQSKQQLVRLAIDEITGEVNRLRIARLDALELQAAGQPLDARSILAALVMPILQASRSADGGSLYIRTVFQARVHADVGQGSFDSYGHVARRFVDAMVRSAPAMTRTEAIWQYEFARGAAIHLIANLDPLSRRFERIASAPGAALPRTPAQRLDERHIERVIDTVLEGFLRTTP